jgi:hypothetical protein
MVLPQTLGGIHVPLADDRTVEYFKALCWARGHLWREGYLEGTDAIDVLQRWAVDSGLIAQIGQDEVQRLMSEAFHD